MQRPRDELSLEGLQRPKKASGTEAGVQGVGWYQVGLDGQQALKLESGGWTLVSRGTGSMEILKPFPVGYRGPDLLWPRKTRPRFLSGNIWVELGHDGT